MRRRVALSLLPLVLLSASAVRAADPPAAPPAEPPPEAKPTRTRLQEIDHRLKVLRGRAGEASGRIDVLKDAVLGGGKGARATIRHLHKMSSQFRLVRLVYALDGAQIFARDDDTGKLDDQKSFDVLSGPLAPGNHTLAVLLVYRGNGYGVFEYLKKYKFTVRDSHTVTVTEGNETRVDVIGYEKGGPTTPLEKRPAVEFQVTNGTAQ